MARGSSRTGKVMVAQDAAGTGQAGVLSFVGTWTIDQAQPDFIDVTALGDTKKQFVQGLVDNYSISVDGFINLGSAAWSEITDGESRKTYIYPDFTNNVTVYWFGTVSYGGNVTGAVSDAIKGTLSGRCTSDGQWAGSGI